MTVAAADRVSGAIRSPTGRISPGGWRWLAFAIIAIAAIYEALYFARVDARVLVVKTPDDAAYFCKIAQNAAQGLGFTFDGIHPTNGYQPLWQYLLVPLYAVVHGTPEALYRWCLILQSALLGAAGLLLCAMCFEVLAAPVVPAIAIGYVALVFRYSMNGMETAAEIFMLVALFAYGMKARVFERSSVPRAFVFGVLLGLVMLARLDLVFLGGVIVTWCLWGAWAETETERRREHLARAIAIVAGAALTVSWYLANNLIAFGHLMPISGVLKSSFPRISHKPIMEKLSPFELVYLAAAIGWLIAQARRGRGAPSVPASLRYFRGAVTAAAAAMLLHTTYTILFMKWAVFPWHFLWYGLVAVMIVAEPIQHVWERRLGPRRTMLYGGALAAASLLVVTGILLLDFVRMDRRLQRGNWRVICYEAGQWAREHSAPGTVFAMADAGIFGYFSERPTINLDGLVNDFAFQDVIRDHGVARYFDENRVAFVVEHHLGPPVDVETYRVASFEVRSHQFDTKDVVAMRRDDEVYRSRSFYHDGSDGVLTVWAWRGSPAASR